MAITHDRHSDVEFNEQSPFGCFQRRDALTSPLIPVTLSHPVVFFVYPVNVCDND